LTPDEISASEKCGPTHHLGCACHEARRDGVEAELRAEVERLTRICREAADKLTTAARHYDDGRLLECVSAFLSARVRLISQLHRDAKEVPR
jgi:hypothetical protein